MGTVVSGLVPPATEPGPDGVRVCEKTMQIEDGKAIDVKIIVDHDMIEAFIDEQIAFTYRIYAKPEFENWYNCSGFEC